MGLTSSIPAPLTQEQEDVKFLGERMPFGDDELRHVYRAYQAMKAETVRQSFLVDIGRASVPEEARDERRRVLTIVEQKLLSPGFGNRWYEGAFLPSSVRDSEYTAGVTTNQQEDVDVDSYTKRAQLEAFFDGLSNCSRRGNDKALKVLFDCCQKQQQEETPPPEETSWTPSPSSDFAYENNMDSSSTPNNTVMIDPMELVTIAYRIGLASNFLSETLQGDRDDDNNDDDNRDVNQFSPDSEHGILHPENHAGVKALAASMVDYANKRKQRLYHMVHPTTTHVSWEDVKEWAENSAPMMGAVLATLTHLLFFPNKRAPPTRASFDFPKLGEFTSALISQKKSSSLLFNLACMSPSLGGEYYRLYTSASDGLSFNRLQNALLGYGGPTLILIQSGTSLFGAFTASPWKESKDFYGNHDCFLYQLLPTTAVYHPSGKASNFMYCNGFARSRGYDQQSHGIGFGGTTDQPRLFLAESFDNCRAAAQDMTFEGGRLLDNNGTTFEIDNLEVWGVGGTHVVEEALGARSLQRDIKNAAIQKARKVDKAQFLDDFRSGLIESKAFQHQQQVQGREGCEVGEDDLKR